MATFSDLFARLDADPRVRGKQFEHVCKWFLTNDPTYKNTLRRGFYGLASRRTSDVPVVSMAAT